MPTFKTIHTTYGLQQMAAAEASGVPINLTQMAVGDGNGNPVTPNEAQTILAREMFRASVNRVFQDPVTPTLFTAELVIPATVGGFVLREVGIFDDAGGLYAVGNLPDTYKPASTEGAFADTVVRLQFMVSNAAIVTLQVDPSVAVATQSWITNNVTAGALLPGGLTHQVLRKKTNADGDTEWADPADANVVVDIIQETQTLTAGQTVVTLAVCTTVGSVAFIEGVKLRADQWVPTDATHANLVGVSFTGSAKIEIVQNLPAGSVPFPLVQAQNLADVPDKAAARTNLDVFSKAEANQLAPVAEVAYFARSAAPTGWLKANGAAISRTAYAALFAAIGTTYGAGDGFNTFNIPDLRGEFLRGLDDGRGVDTGRALGSAQTGQNASHTHSVYDPGHAHSYINVFPVSNSDTPNPGPSSVVVSVTPSSQTTGTSYTNISINSSGGTEARPRNVALLACIKF
jgi:phage-related tail fiber protein